MDQSQLLKTNQSQQSIFYFFILFFSSIYLFHKSFILYFKIEKFKMLFLELNIRLQKNKWRGQDIVKLMTCPLIKLVLFRLKEKKEKSINPINYEEYMKKY